MKKRPIVAFLAALSFCVIAAPLFAHHGTANFDTDKKLNHEGDRHGMVLGQSTLLPEVRCAR